MSDIKSAREIAMEKVAELGEATEEERLKWRFVPEGEKLGVKYFKEDCSLITELSNYEEKARKFIVEGTTSILIRNIGIPRNDSAKKNNKKAMEGIKTLKSDKVAVENVFSKMRRVFEHYAQNGEQQKQQAYVQLKAEFTARVQQAMQQQMGLPATNINVDVERQPQFHEEWQRLQGQLDMQYVKLLDEYKQELLGIA